ncbi:MAG TPA: zinc-ribbon domain-containing protein [Anaerolineales bacterium]|nr:zinc-ribbon domain-containing protein [Anaerolineales bacterium]
MDIGSIFLILGLLVLVGVFVSRPFFEHRATTISAAEREVSTLLAERDHILNALQELDFDFNLGKIPEKDYPDQRAVLLQRGAQVLRQLDDFQVGGAEADTEASLEAAIAARRADGANLAPALNGTGRRLPPSSPDDSLEALIANRRRERNEKSAGFCPSCGKPVQKSDRFCPKCGADLA